MKWKLVILSATVLVSAAIYATLWNALPLTWDDSSNIFGNPFFTMHHWWGVWLEPYFGLYVPVTQSFWALLYWAGEGAAWPFHAFNLVIHCANTILVFFLLEALAKRWRLSCPLATALAVGVFALHPLQVEAVAWISGGRDLLSTFFALAAVGAYFRCPSRRGFAFATLLYAVALLCKPNVAILPLVVVALDRFLFQRKSIVRMSLWLVLSVAAIVMTQFAQAEHFTDRTEWWQRPLVMLDTYTFYLQKLIWPAPLSGNYARTPELIVANSALIWRDVVCFLTGTGLWFWGWSRDRRFRIVGLWFLLLLPVSGVVPFGYQNISQEADHYNYLPMVAVGALSLLLWERLWVNRALIFVPVALSGMWAWASWLRTDVWKSDETFFTDMARSAPDSYNTALGMSVVMCEDKKDYESGLMWVDKALKAVPNDILALSNRAYCLLHAGRNQDVLQMDSYLDHLDLENLGANQPTAYSSFLASLGTALIEEHQYEVGYNYLCEAFRVKPSEPNHVHNLMVAADILKQNGIEPTCDR